MRVCSHCSKELKENDVVYVVTVRPMLNDANSMMSEYMLCEECFRDMLTNGILPGEPKEVNGELWEEEKLIPNEEDGGFTVIVGKSGERDICLDLSGFGSILIAGDEGCGKTSLMDLILHQCEMKGASTYVLNLDTYDLDEADDVLDEIYEELEKRKLLRSMGIREEYQQIFLGIDKLEDYVVNGIELNMDIYRKILDIVSAKPELGIHTFILTEDSLLFSVLSGVRLCTWFRFCGHSGDSKMFLRGDDRAVDLDMPGVFISTIPEMDRIETYLLN